jgi:hypothetical protein
MPSIKDGLRGNPIKIPSQSFGPETVPMWKGNAFLMNTLIPRSLAFSYCRATFTAEASLISTFL